MSTESLTALTEELRGWLAGRLPEEWFESAPEVVCDREEITVVGGLRPPGAGSQSSQAESTAALAGRIQAFREETREQRIAIAKEIEHRFGRKVSWGVECGSVREMFTTQSVPVMTRLRQPERRVLDTLVEAGVARSRSEALAWCIRLVGKNTDNWLTDLREALGRVEQVRATGPDASA